jgi:hypothetical protein
MLQKTMRIKEEAEDLKTEIESLNEFVRNREAHRLTWIASLYLPATLAATIICWFSADMTHFGWRIIDWEKVSLMSLMAFFIGVLLYNHKKINHFIFRNTNK